jgi:hypothetical protein
VPPTFAIPAFVVVVWVVGEGIARNMLAVKIISQGETGGRRSNSKLKNTHIGIVGNV